jgi:hypothetical protein
MNNKGTKTRRLISGAAIGILLGIAFVVGPIEISVLAVPASVCGGAFLCLRNSARFPAAGLSLIAFAAVLVMARAARPDALDKRPASFTNTVVTVSDLVRGGVAYEPGEFEWGKAQVRLPSTTPTVREIVLAINEQTSLKARVFRCGTVPPFQPAWVGKIMLSLQRSPSLEVGAKR